MGTHFLFITINKQTGSFELWTKNGVIFSRNK